MEHVSSSGRFGCDSLCFVQWHKQQLLWLIWFSIQQYLLSPGCVPALCSVLETEPQGGPGPPWRHSGTLPTLDAGLVAAFNIPVSLFLSPAVNGSLPLPRLSLSCPLVV